MNEQAIQNFLSTTAQSWRQAHPAAVSPGHQPGKRLTRAQTCTVVKSARKDGGHIVPETGASTTASSLLTTLRPGARLHFELMRQARVMPRQRDDASDLVDLRIGDRVVRVRLDTHEVVAVI